MGTRESNAYYVWYFLSLLCYNGSMNYNFEWDIDKAKSNITKHQISFESATSIFRDANALSLSDEGHNEDEERWLTIGIDEVTRILFVVHTYISIDDKSCNIRIISARKATQKEQKTYYEG